MTAARSLARLEALEREVAALPPVLTPKTKRLIVAGFKRAAARNGQITSPQAQALASWMWGLNPEADASIWAEITTEELQAIVAAFRAGSTRSGDGVASGLPT